MKDKRRSNDGDFRRRLSLREVGELCGRNASTVQRWHDEGLPRKPTAREVMHFLARRRGGAELSERARLAREMADRHALDNARRRGELVLASIVGERDKRVASELAGQLDALGPRLVDTVGAPMPVFLRRHREESDAIRHHLADVYLSFAEEYRTGFVDPHPRARGNGHDEV